MNFNHEIKLQFSKYVDNVTNKQRKKFQIIGIFNVSLTGPNNEPLFTLVGEGHRERLLLYVKCAMEFFTELGLVS